MFSKNQKVLVPKVHSSLHKGIFEIREWEKWLRKIRANPSQILTTSFLRLKAKLNCFFFFHCKSKIPLFNQVDMGNMRKTVSALWPTCPNARRHYDQTNMLEEIWTVRCLPRPMLIMIGTNQSLQKQCHL